MADKSAAMGCGFMLTLAIVCLGYNWFEVSQQKKFAPAVASQMSEVPGARLVSSQKSGDLINPVSWFSPATTRVVYARPDTSTTATRFFLLSFGIEEKNPAIWLVDVNCKSKTHITYFPSSSGDPGESAFTDTGDQLTTPDGKIFMRHDTNIDLPPDQITQFCKTDWSNERAAVNG